MEYYLLTSVGWVWYLIQTRMQQHLWILSKLQSWLFFLYKQALLSHARACYPETKHVLWMSVLACVCLYWCIGNKPVWTVYPCRVRWNGGPCQELRVVVSALCSLWELELLQEEAFGSSVIMDSGWEGADTAWRAKGWVSQWFPLWLVKNRYGWCLL